MIPAATASYQIRAGYQLKANSGGIGISRSQCLKNGASAAVASQPASQKSVGLVGRSDHHPRTLAKTVYKPNVALYTAPLDSQALLLQGVKGTSSARLDHQEAARQSVEITACSLFEAAVVGMPPHGYGVRILREGQHSV